MEHHEDDVCGYPMRGGSTCGQRRSLNRRDKRGRLVPTRYFYYFGIKKAIREWFARRLTRTYGRAPMRVQKTTYVKARRDIANDLLPCSIAPVERVRRYLPRLLEGSFRYSKVVVSLNLFLWDLIADDPVRFNDGSLDEAEQLLLGGPLVGNS